MSIAQFLLITLGLLLIRLDAHRYWGQFRIESFALYALGFLMCAIAWGMRR